MRIETNKQMDERILQQLPYVKSLAWRYGEYHRDDVYGDGVLALVRAARAYNPDRGVKFFTYAKGRIDGQIKDYWRRIGRANPDMVSNPVRVLYSQNHDPAAHAEKKELREIIREAIGALEVRQQMVIELYYFQEFTLEAIGCIMNCCQANVLRIQNKAIERLRRLLVKIFN